MIRLLPFILLPLLASCGEFQPNAESQQLKLDIKPTGNLGSIIVDSPEVGGIDLSRYRIEIRSRSYNDTVAVLQLNQGVNLDSAEKYCVKIIVADEYYTEQCDVTVTTGSTTHLETGFVRIIWNVTSTAVDVGPKVEYVLVGDKQKVKIVANRIMEVGKFPSEESLFFVDKLTASYGNVGALKDDLKTHQVLKEKLTAFDITPPDRRIYLNFHAPLSKYAAPQKVIGEKPNYYEIASFGFIAHKVNRSTLVPKDFIISNEYSKYHSSYYSNKHSPEEGFLSWRRIDLELTARPEYLTYAMYPLDSELDQGFYELNVSGISAEFNETSEFAAESLNVDKINGKSDGFYKVNVVNSNEKYSLGWYNIARGDYSYPTYKPTKTDLGNFMPTESSFYVLRGFDYEVNTFMYDDSANLAEQSTHKLYLK